MIPLTRALNLLFPKKAIRKKAVRVAPKSDCIWRANAARVWEALESIDRGIRNGNQSLIQSADQSAGFAANWATFQRGVALYSRGWLEHYRDRLCPGPSDY